MEYDILDIIRVEGYKTYFYIREDCSHICFSDLKTYESEAKKASSSYIIFVIPETNKNYKVIDDCLIELDTNTLIYHDNNSKQYYKDATHIAPFAFDSFRPDYSRKFDEEILEFNKPLKDIGYGAFSDCQFKNYRFNSSFEVFNFNIFQGYCYIKSIKLPSTCKKIIEDETLKGDSIESIYIDENNPYLGNGSKGSYIYDKESLMLIKGTKEIKKIDDNIKGIKRHAFSHLIVNRMVELKSNIKVVEPEAFYNSRFNKLLIDFDSDKIEFETFKNCRFKYVAAPNIDPLNIVNGDILTAAIRYLPDAVKKYNYKKEVLDSYNNILNKQYKDYQKIILNTPKMAEFISEHFKITKACKEYLVSIFNKAHKNEEASLILNASEINEDISIDLDPFKETNPLDELLGSYTYTTNDDGSINILKYTGANKVVRLLDVKKYNIKNYSSDTYSDLKLDTIIIPGIYKHLDIYVNIPDKVTAIFEEGIETINYRYFADFGRKSYKMPNSFQYIDYTGYNGEIMFRAKDVIKNSSVFIDFDNINKNLQTAMVPPSFNSFWAYLGLLANSKTKEIFYVAEKLYMPKGYKILCPGALNHVDLKRNFNIADWPSIEVIYEHNNVPLVNFYGKMYFPDNIKVAKRNAFEFRGNPTAKFELFIGKNLKEIGKDSFGKAFPWENLTNIHVDEENMFLYATSKGLFKKNNDECIISLIK